MKTKNLLWAALSMTAALVMTACSNDDNDMTEAPVAPSTSKTIPYTVTVGGDDATTRATVNDDPKNRILYFASGDKLYIWGENIQGVLDLKDGDENKTTGATFSGELTYSGSGSPADDLPLTATLVSAQQNSGQVSVDDAGAVSVNYPTTAYCSTINDAVQQYSRLTGTSTYGAKAFTLTQQTAFLNFVITFEDATTTGTELSAVVSNNSAAVCTANVTTVTDNGVKAKFVLPVAKGTTLSSANVKMGDKEAISFGASQTLKGKVYNVTKTQAAKTLAQVTAGDIGKIVGMDGKIYATKAAAEAVSTGNAAAVIAYVGRDTYDATFKNGLAIALADEVGSNWSTAMSTCDAKTAITGAKWCLPSQDQWKQMFKANGGNDASYTDLNTTITTAGGTTLQDKRAYWSSSESSPGVNADVVYLRSGSAMWIDADESSGLQVRACLAF